MAALQMQRILQRRMVSSVLLANTNTALYTACTQQQQHKQLLRSFHTRQSTLLRKQPKIDMKALENVDPILAMRMKTASTKKRLKMIKEAHILTANTKVEDISLNNIRYLPGAKTKKIRVGRGDSSRRGNTSGRGMKGQRARTGFKIPSGFEGGSTKIYKRVPKFGFSNRAFSLRYQIVSLEKLQYFIDTGRIDPNEGTITMQTLYEAGLVRGLKYPGVKLLSNGVEHFRAKVDIELPRASKAAIRAIEKNGGSIRCIYYGRRAIHAMMRPDKYTGPVKMSMPPPKLFKYYMNPEIRGYLADSSPVNPLRDLVPDNERDITKELGDLQLEEHLKKKANEAKKSRKKRK